MYHNQLAVAIKSNGKILREFKDIVYLPFGTEYSVFIKNLSTVNVLMKMQIDGQEMLEDGLVLPSNSEIDLERSIKSKMLTEGNRFKFIERTSNIENHRGIGITDGIVKISYQFERKLKIPPIYHGFKYTVTSDSYSSNSVLRSTSGSSSDLSGSCSVNSANISNDSKVTAYCSNNAGITVPGSISNQKFSLASWFPVEEEIHCIILKLLGQNSENVQVTNPITVKHKVDCQTCGRKNKVNAKFCTECGTGLIIIN